MYMYGDEISYRFFYCCYTNKIFNQFFTETMYFYFHRKVKLNDELLEMNGSDLPSLEPKPHSGDVPLAPKTFGFIVIPEADVQLCKQYHRHDEGKIVSC